MSVQYVGLDLRDPTVDGLVRRLYFSRLVVLVDREGLDREDGLQELFLRLLERQARAGSRFDGRRGTESTYLYRAGHSALSDWLRAERRLRQRDGDVGMARDAALDGGGQWPGPP